MLKFVDMNTPQNAGAVSLKDSIIEVEGWTAALYQQNFMDFLEQQPYIMGTLMEADEGMDDDTHSWMLKSVLLLKWSFQKMGCRLTILSNEKWQGVIEEKLEIYAFTGPEQEKEYEWSNKKDFKIKMSSYIRIPSMRKNALKAR